MTALPRCPGAVSESFALPDTRVRLVFAEGRRRLVGAVLLQDPPDRPQPFPPNPFPRP